MFGFGFWYKIDLDNIKKENYLVKTLSNKGEPVLEVL